jgi:hypothetical protein
MTPASFAPAMRRALSMRLAAPAGREGGPAAATLAAARAPPMLSSRAPRRDSANSRADSKRSVGSFARDFWITQSSCQATFGLSVEGLAGRSFTTRLRISTLLPLKGACR